MSKFIPDGFCDFAGCFNLIGKAEFGAEWTGEEFTAKTVRAWLGRIGVKTL